MEAARNAETKPEAVGDIAINVSESSTARIAIRDYIEVNIRLPEEAMADEARLSVVGQTLAAALAETRRD